jgi:hypothetical protein
MIHDECFGVMEKRVFGEPEMNVGASVDFERAKEIADKGIYRRVVKMWTDDSIYCFGDETLYRSFFWPGRSAYNATWRIREG